MGGARGGGGGGGRPGGGGCKTLARGPTPVGGAAAAPAMSAVEGDPPGEASGDEEECDAESAVGSGAPSCVDSGTSALTGPVA